MLLLYRGHTCTPEVCRSRSAHPSRRHIPSIRSIPVDAAARASSTRADTASARSRMTHRSAGADAVPVPVTAIEGTVGSATCGQPERLVDLPSSGRAVERQEVQTRRALRQQLLAQIARILDADLPYGRRIVLDGMQPGSEFGGEDGV